MSEKKFEHFFSVEKELFACHACFSVPVQQTNLKCRQLCLIQTDVDPKFLSRLGKIRIMRKGIICIGRDWDLLICPV